ncbi:MAG: hypothetical protein L0Z50_09725, partial [Verrucomicrobiales bacterium]|nr:hypothetical protein [Verrucomicrobiales bacterium]
MKTKQELCPPVTTPMRRWKHPRMPKLLLCVWIASSACLDALAAGACGVSIGKEVSVENTLTLGLRVRDCAGTTCSIQAKRRFDSDHGTVEAGPKTANGYTWWQIRWQDGQLGWSAEALNGVCLLKVDVTPSVTLTLYVRDGSPSGSVLSDARVTGSDAAGKGFDQTTDSGGYVTITGKAGKWQFTAARPGYQVNIWNQDITVTGQKNAFLIPTPCNYSLSATGASHSSSSDSRTFSVEVGSGCEWRAGSGASWITIISGSSGSGNGPVRYAVAANTGSSPRTGTISVQDQNFTITQEGSCSYFLGLTSASFGADSSSGSFSVETGNGCTWTASTAYSWIHTTSSSSHGTVNYTVDANMGPNRNGTITVQGQKFTITQAGATSSQPRGVDVSHWNGTVNWSQVSNPGGRVFAFIHATSGKNTSDNQFPINAAGAHAAGLLVGAYHFAYPEHFTAHEEAQKFLSVAGAYVGTGYLPPALDIEDSDIVSDDSHPYRMGKTALSRWIRDWCSEVEEATGVKPMIYSTRWYANNYFDTSLNQYRFWVPTYPADPSSTPGSLAPWTSWTFQQYRTDPRTQGTDLNSTTEPYVAGTCPGISGYADLDSFNGNLSELQALANQTPCTYSLSPTISSLNAGSGSGSF